MPRASEITLGDIEQVFFLAMREGWIAGNKGQPIEGMPGGYRITHVNNDWTVIDEYLSTIGTRSEGTTRIWFRDVLVWSMHYWGWYEERAIPFLMSALKETYSACRFFGGRGHLRHKEGTLEYRNFPHPHSSFSDFRGYEFVLDLPAADDGTEIGLPFVLNDYKVGSHRYSGMLMVDLPLSDSRADILLCALQRKLDEIDLSPVFSDGKDIEISGLEDIGIDDFMVGPLLDEGNVFFYLRVEKYVFVHGRFPIDQEGGVSMEDVVQKLRTAILARVERTLRAHRDLRDLRKIA